MSFSFSIPSKPKSKSNQHDTSSSTFSDDDQPPKTYITEFNQSDASQPLESNPKPIAPLPDTWPPPSIKLKNLQSNPSDSTLQFADLQNPKTDDSIGYGLNVRGRGEKDDFDLRKLREELRNLPDDPEEMNDFEQVPVEGFGLALLSGYGWKEGRGGIGRNSKEDVKVHRVTNWVGRRGLGFSGEVTIENNGDDQL